MKIRAEKPWCDLLWREAKEQGLTLQITPFDPDFELVINDLTSLKGIQTSGPDAETLKIIHSEAIRGLSERNPQWSDENDQVPMFKKPKDLGTTISRQHLCVTVFLGDKIERERLARNQAKLIRSIIQAFLNLTKEKQNG